MGGWWGGGVGGRWDGGKFRVGSAHRAGRTGRSARPAQGPEARHSAKPSTPVTGQCHLSVYALPGSLPCSQLQCWLSCPSLPFPPPPAPPSSMPLYWKCMWSTSSRPGLAAARNSAARRAPRGRRLPGAGREGGPAPLTLSGTLQGCTERLPSRQLRSASSPPPPAAPWGPDLVAAQAANSSRPSVTTTLSRWNATVAGEAYSRLATSCRAAGAGAARVGQGDRRVAATLWRAWRLRGAWCMLAQRAQDAERAGMAGSQGDALAGWECSAGQQRATGHCMQIHGQKAEQAATQVGAR